jgi:hypothetical protein
MKTKEEMISEGYKEEDLVKCYKCGSWNCHAYTDTVVCFECFNKINRVKENVSKLPSSVWDKLRT